MGIMDRTYLVRFLKKEGIDSVLRLSNLVHGDNYLSDDYLQEVIDEVNPNEASCSFTLDLNEGDGTPEKLIGFIITRPPGKWINSFAGTLSMEEWEVETDKVAYFKCNTLEEEFRGKGFGTLLLNRSIGACKRLGAGAGLAHISVGSVNQHNYKYFMRAGGRDIKTYLNHWDRGFNNKDYVCSRCGDECQCSVSEMILDFSTHKELSYV